MLDDGDDFSGANEVADFDQKAFNLARYAGTDLTSAPVLSDTVPVAKTFW